MDPGMRNKFRGLLNLLVCDVNAVYSSCVNEQYFQINRLFFLFTVYILTDAPTTLVQRIIQYFNWQY